MTILRDTVEFLHQTGIGDAIKHEFCHEKTVACIELPNAVQLRFVLAHPVHRYNFNEGELLWFIRLGDVCLQRMVFSFEKLNDGSFACLIGGIQGPRHGPRYEVNSDEREADEQPPEYVRLAAKDREECVRLVKTAEKAAYGMMPKSLALFGLQEFLAQLNISRIVSVSNENVLSQGDKVFFDYDGFLESAGSSRVLRSWFTVPLRYRRKSTEEIKPNKRSMYAKRFAMLDDVSTQIQRSVSELKALANTGKAAVAQQFGRSSAPSGITAVAPASPSNQSHAPAVDPASTAHNR
jgi:uncharacterized protein VirK/YbjX